ncbi:Ig-like domain-containing protein [Bibersteinia trehalosi]|uniref:Ig-like domain-containing protein n=1 Tax=Bibersteinia trehalosi TaxID=47735 RepID=UPI000AACD01E|nr:Ig-like domain-containing protein [Bibersteinia trehalosi]
MVGSKGSVLLSGNISLPAEVEAKSVMVNIHGQYKEAQITEDGLSWRLLVSGNELTKQQGEQTVLVKLTAQENGVSVNATDQTTYLVDTEIEQPVITFNTITDDDIINLSESQQVIKISGNVTNARVGDKVQITIGEAILDVDVKANGEFEFSVEGKTLINHRSVSAKITTRDEAGNSASAMAVKSYQVDIDPPKPLLQLDKVTGDNFLGMDDLSGKPITLTGNIDGLDVDDTKHVVLALCGCSTCAGSRKTLQVDVQEDGSFSTDVDVMELINYNTVVATLSSSDKAGNVAEDVSTSQSFTKIEIPGIPGLSPADPIIKLNPITGDNFINQNESTQTVKITGRLENVVTSTLVAQKSIKLQFIKDSKVVEEKDVPFDVNQRSTLVEKPPIPSFTYEINGSELAKYDTINAIFTNRDRKTYNDSQSYTYSAGSPSWVDIHLTDIAADNVLDNTETQQATTLVKGTYSATPSPTAAEGVTVYVDLVLNINGVRYIHRVDGASGNFEIEVATKDLITSDSKKIDLEARLFDTAGSSGGTRRHTLSYQVQDNEINQPEIIIDEIGTINADYVTKNPTTRIYGSFKTDDDVLNTNQQITLNLNGIEKTAVIQGNRWFVDVDTSELVAANGKVSAKIAVSDLSGNKAENSTEQSYLVKVISPKVQITLDKVSDDNLLTVTELNSDVVIQGKVTGEYNPTDKVKLAIGTETFEVAIQNGTFSQAVNPEILRYNSSVSAKIETQDKAGNSANAVATQDYQVQALDIQINFAKVTADNLINVTERLAEEIEISGTLTGNDVALAQTVLLHINGTQYSVGVSNDFSFSVKISGETLLNNPNYRIHAQVLDSKLQVQATNSHQYEVQERAAADIHITNVGIDSIINVNEAFGGVRIKGKLNFNGSLYQQGYNTDALKALVVTIGDKKYYAGFNRDDFSFHFDVSREEFEGLVGKSVSYEIWDHKSQNLHYLSGSDTNKTVNTLNVRNATDKQIIASEFAKISVEFDESTIVGNTVIPVKQQMVVSGLVSGTAQAGDTVEIKVDEKTYQGTVAENLRFNIRIDNADLAEVNTKLTATLISKDLSGKEIRVDDVAEIAWTNNVNAKFVSPHEALVIDPRERSIMQHSNSDYKYPYFLHVTKQGGGGPTFTGFLNKMPFGGYNPNNADPLAPAEIKYYFATNADYDTGWRHPHLSNREAYVEYTDELKALIRQAYETFNATANVKFVETSVRSEADTIVARANFGMIDADAPADSELRGSIGIGKPGSYIFFNSGTNGLGTGAKYYDTYAAFHEIYHSLGAGHSDGGFTDLFMDGSNSYAAGEDNSSEFTIMSYFMHDYHGNHEHVTGFSIYDLAFMHYRFGVNQNYRSGNDVYGFNHYASQIKDGTTYIWDGGGVDTFDASNENEGVLVNLTPGSWNYYRSQLSDAFVIKEKQVISASDYASYFSEQNLDGVTVTGVLDKDFSHTVYTKGQSFIGYGTQIENVHGSKFADILIGNNADNNMSGGLGNDKIYGGLGNDYIDGGEGADEMEGGLGDDRYVVDNVGDKVIEKADEGTDTVYSSISYSLPENVENLYLIGSDNLNATGNELANTLVGNDGNNILDGGEGNDILDGGRGSDTLTGGAGADIFRFSAILDGSVDTIIDFTVSEDKIQLDKTIFTALTDAASVQAYIQYDSATGKLSYDPDSTGIADAIHFATLTAGLDASAIQYEII